MVPQFPDIILSSTKPQSQKSIIRTHALIELLDAEQCDITYCFIFSFTSFSPTS